MVRVPLDGPVHEAQQPSLWPPPCPAVDAPYAFGPDLSGAQHKQETPAPQDLAVLAEKRGDRPPEPSLVRRYHLHPYASGLFVLGRDYGLVQPQGFGVAIV